MRAWAIAILALIVHSSSVVWAGGYEKAVMWSSHWGALGGAAAAGVTGAEALFFNPAGLAVVSGATPQELSAQFSPTWSRFSAPVLENKTEKDSNVTFSPIFGLIYSMAPSDRWGFGVGGYVSAGNRVQYRDVPRSQFSSTYDVGTDVIATELAAGAGYKISDTLRVGASWRVAFVDAGIRTVQPVVLGVVSGTPVVALANVEMDHLKSTEPDGFRVGLQYTPSEIWGLGLSVRAPIQFKVTGSGSGTASFPSAVTSATVPVTVSDASAKSELPLQISFGGMYAITPKVFNLFAEYTFTQYSKLDQVDLGGTFSFSNPTGIGASSQTQALADIQQKWKDQHNFRVAGEWVAGAMPIRAGYVYTSQVVPEGYARSTFSSPGNGHTFTLGTGRLLQDGHLDVGIAGEYSFAQGTVSSPEQSSTFTGDYHSRAYAVHLGARYWF